MTATIIDGKALANKLLEQLAKTITSSHSSPRLAVILLGHDPASEIYVQNKQLACEQVGIMSTRYTFDDNVSEAELLSLIHQLNDDDTVHGILVQLPLPPHIHVEKVIQTISPKKDVDGFQQHSRFSPCTAKAIMQLLDSTHVKLKNKIAVVVGQSMIVGKPTAIALEIAGCHVIRCDKNTKNLRAEVSKADILVVAAGQANLIQGDWIKDGAIVIDVGINRLNNHHVVGDVEFEKAKQRAGFITPVPGGVGPMTVAALMQNTVLAAQQ